MAQMLHLELTEAATPPSRLTHAMRETTTRLGVLADVWQGVTPEYLTFVLSSGLLVSHSPALGRGQDPAADPFLVDFGFARAITVDFTFDSRHAGADQQHDHLLQLVFGLLETFPGDAVLHYEYSEVYLARLGGRVILCEDADVWPPDALDHVPVPYERSHLAFRTR